MSSDQRGKIILVTGSSGLSGSEVVTYFHNQGFTVHGIDNNQRAEFFGVQGDTGWVTQRLTSTLPGFRHHHQDIRAQGLLDVDGGLGTQEEAGAVEMRAEGRPLFGNFGQLLQAENLKAAGISEDRPLPVHEPVQAAKAVPNFAQTTPSAANGPDSGGLIDVPATVITTNTRVLTGRPTFSWAAALMAMGVFVGLVSAVVARGCVSRMAARSST